MAVTDDLPTGSHPVCPRCGDEASPDAVWCSGCGLNLRKQEALPSADAYAARAREERWLESQSHGGARDGVKAGPRQASAPEGLSFPRPIEAREERRPAGDSEPRSPARLVWVSAVALIALLAAGTVWTVTEWEAPLLGSSPFRGGSDTSESPPAPDGTAENLESPAGGSGLDPVGLSPNESLALVRATPIPSSALPSGYDVIERTKGSSSAGPSILAVVGDGTGDEWYISYEAASEEALQNRDALAESYRVNGDFVDLGGTSWCGGLGERPSYDCSAVANGLIVDVSSGRVDTEMSVELGIEFLDSAVAYVSP